MIDLYPKTIAENVIFRHETLTKCEHDEMYRGLTRALTANDVRFFFNVWLSAEDPFAEKGLRHGVPHVRFRPIVTYPVQDEFILDLERCIALGENIIADKSRDMLATYMVLGVGLHGWLYKGWKGVLTSWREDEVDGKEDTSTHFGKLRFWLRSLPSFLLPVGWDWKKNSSFMRLQNPENGATLTGTAPSANLGSSRREDFFFLDELSKWQPEHESGWVSCSDATRCKIAVWTPHGSGNRAAQLMRGDEVKHKHHLHWYFHPEKKFTSEEHREKIQGGKIFDKVRKYIVQLNNDQSKTPVGCYIDQYGRIRSEWYDLECDKRDSEDISENLDCDYLTTGQPVFDSLKCEANKYASKSPQMGNLEWKIRPRYSRENGFCENIDELLVEFIPNVNGEFKIWEHPVDGWADGYVVSGDTAEGLAQGDFNSASVGRRFIRSKEDIVTVPDGEEFRMPTVAEINNHSKTFEFSEQLVKLAVYYKFAWIVPERNNTSGGAVVNELFKMYRKLFHDQIMTKGYPEQKDRIGFSTNQSTKGTIIKTLGKAISFGTIYDPCEEFWGECLTYVNNNGTMEAQGKSKGERCFDDRVMDRALKYWAHKELPSPVRKRVVEPMDEWRKKFMESVGKGGLVGWVVDNKGIEPIRWVA